MAITFLLLRTKGCPIAQEKFYGDKDAIESEQDRGFGSGECPLGAQKREREDPRKQHKESGKNHEARIKRKGMNQRRDTQHQRGIRDDRAQNIADRQRGVPPPHRTDRKQKFRQGRAEGNDEKSDERRV